MQYQYDALELTMELGSSISKFFFKDVTTATTAEEIRARAEAMCIAVARVQAVLAVEGPVGAAIAMDIRQLEQSIKSSLLKDVHKAMQPGGFIWKLYQQG